MSAKTNKLYTRLAKIALFIALVYVLDLVVGAGLKAIYFKPKEGKYFDQTYALDSTKAEILIQGSSKASHGYISQIIEDSLHMSCYNAGREGSNFLHQYATIHSMLTRYKPKIIIWDFWEGLYYNQPDYD